MKRPQLNFLIDSIAFAEFALLLSTGVLVRYLLPPGSGHYAQVLGLDRHAWGGVHFWIAMAFLATLALHLALHWKWIVCVLKGQRSQNSGKRLAIGLLALGLIVAVAAAPLAAPVRSTAVNSSSQPATIVEHTDAEHLIRGSMTLAEASHAAGVSVESLKQSLRLPPSVRPDERLGPLRRQFGFEMQDARDAVNRLQGAPPDQGNGLPQR